MEVDGGVAGAAAADTGLSRAGEEGRDTDWRTAEGSEFDFGRVLGTRWIVHPSCNEQAGRGLECVEKRIGQILGAKIPGWHASDARNRVVGSSLRSFPPLTSRPPTSLILTGDLFFPVSSSILPLYIKRWSVEGMEVLDSIRVRREEIEEEGGSWMETGLEVEERGRIFSWKGGGRGERGLLIM